MRIKTRLSITFVTVLMFILLIISSYSILFIRNYLERKAVNEALSQANSIALNLRTFDNAEDAKRYLLATANLLETIVVLSDSVSKPIWASNKIENLEVQILPDKSILDLKDEYVGASVYLEYGDAKSVLVLRSKKAISNDLMPIRYIIYSGMLLSAIVIVVVSFLTARGFSRPIQELASSAEDIAAGNFERQLILNRKDEFGNLAESLNSMALTLKKESEDLRAINEKQKQFYADIAHEIKNPMHTMMGSIDILSMDNLSDEHFDKYIKMVKSQAHRVYKLFEDLVTLQKYDSYETKLNFTQFDIASLVKKIGQTHEFEAKSKGIKLSCSVKNALVTADESKIGQVLDNLISNAIKNTSEGAIKIKSQYEQSSIKIMVEDTGLGMNPDEVHRIFERFYRTDSSRSRDSGGSGLGLAITKSILSAHGSDIHVNSSPSKGSVFSFLLPIALEKRNESERNL